MNREYFLWRLCAPVHPANLQNAREINTAGDEGFVSVVIQAICGAFRSSAPVSHSEDLEAWPRGMLNNRALDTRRSATFPNGKTETQGKRHRQAPKLKPWITKPYCYSTLNLTFFFVLTCSQWCISNARSSFNYVGFLIYLPGPGLKMQWSGCSYPSTMTNLLYI